MREEYHKSFSQPTVSRAITEVDDYLKAGGIAVKIEMPPELLQSIGTFDPNILEQGQRQDGRTHRQRGKLDALEDDWN